MSGPAHTQHAMWLLMYTFLQVGFTVFMTQHKYPEINYGQNTVRSDQGLARTSQLDLMMCILCLVELSYFVSQLITKIIMVTWDLNTKIVQSKLTLLVKIYSFFVIKYKPIAMDTEPSQFSLILRLLPSCIPYSAATKQNGEDRAWEWGKVSHLYHGSYNCC